MERGDGQDFEAAEHAPSPPAHPQPTYLVGIGASAGGLEALERLFKAMPDDTGMAFVVIQHLSPDFRSLMDELLARHTRMAVRRVTDGMEVAPNSIYLIPPKKEMIVSGGRLLLTDKDPQRDLSLPIDHFFRSLAQDAGRRAVAIVLSGTGSDGSRGIRDVSEAGGLVVVQRPETAQFDGMPRSAVDTGVVDTVLAPEEMPDTLLRHATSTTREGGTSYDQAEGLEAIFKLLRDEYGIDFSFYKPNTVGRRIERRQALGGFADLERYVERLRAEPAERNALYRDLLIGVTRFFRDREAFEHLERHVIPDLLARKKADEELRVWVAGCATGEEAYSLAILFDERLRLLPRRPGIKIFASDVHRASLEVASAGVYGSESLAHVTPSRLERYFVKKADGFHVTSELRQMIVFAVHNVIKDAPFTRLDMIACRNLLIYFQQPVQKKVLSLFHFGLKTDGVLFLGPSETPGELASEFEDLDAHWKIFRKQRDVRLPPDLRLPLSVPMHLRATAAAPGTSLDPSLTSAYDRLLEKHMPPGVLITDGQMLVHSFGDASRYMKLPKGRVTTHLLELVNDELRLPIAGALQRAQKDRAPVVHPELRVRRGDEDVRLRLTVEPILNRQSNPTHYFVSFESLGAPPPRVQATELPRDAASSELVSSLEEELRHTRENLQATVEELETSNEEMQAANEELVASNEELQSTNEELHSVNEELYTVNAEYQKKIQELTELTDDMDNLLRSTDIGTIFLDRDLCIRKFTPQIARAFDLVPHDVGRRIDSFSHNIRYADLLRDLSSVLETGTPIEKEVQDRHGHWFFLRILPYRARSTLDGVVLSLIDVSLLKRAEARLAQMSAIVESSDDAIIGADLSGRIETWNRGAEQLYGYAAEEVLGQPLSILHCDPPGESHQPDWTPDCLERMRAGLPAGYQRETVRRRRDGETLDVLVSCSAIRDSGGYLTGVSLIARDIGERKRAEKSSRRYADELERANRELRESVERRRAAEEEARQGVDRRDRFLAILSHELRNPLAAIATAAQLLERATASDALRRQAQGAISRQSRQMARLLDDLLDVSRVTRNKIEIHPQTMDVCAATREALDLVRPLSEARRHDLRVELPDDPVFIDGDPARLQQIEVNLLTNAIKYTPPGGRVTLIVAREGNEVVLRVCDSGSGIPVAMREKVFDLFVQLDGAVGNSDGGMGVGLTLVRALVELHGGTVAVREGPGGTGSEFVVRLPASSAQPAAQRDVARTDDALSGLRVLLVEDNADVRETTLRLLATMGCEAEAAEDGPSGVATIERRAPDVALVDIGMPGMNGYEVARRVRALGSRKPVLLIALTGFGQADDRAKAFAAGFDEHLVKPIDFDELSRVIQRLCA